MKEVWEKNLASAANECKARNKNWMNVKNSKKDGKANKDNNKQAICAYKKYANTFNK